MVFFTLVGPIRWTFLFHAIAGSLALALLMVPLLSKKGGTLHVRTGWIYTVLMVMVGVTALVITPWRMNSDPHRNPETQSFAIFLAFIAVLALSSLWFGLIALKHKTRKTGTIAPQFVLPPMLLGLFAGLVEFVGLQSGSSLLIVFPLLGFWISRKQIRYWTLAPVTRMHWWYAHMNGMSIACISTVTAFLVTALPRIWPSDITRSPVLWVAPGVIMGSIFSRWQKSYALQFKDV